MNDLTRLSIQELAKRCQAAGYVAYIYPRKKRVSLNGFPAVDFQAARTKMIALLAK